MSSEDNKTITFDKPKKPHNKKSIGWIIGVVVLILISITFILPTTFLAGNHEIVFGSIKGKDVALTNQYFQTQASMLSSQYGADANTLQGSYTIWNQAFLSTIANIGLNDMAKNAGAKTTDNYVDRAIVNSGFYSSENGTFDPEVYKDASSYEKNTFRSYMEESVPANFVVSDISRAHSSNGEIALVKDISAKARAFDYVLIDYFLLSAYKHIPAAMEIINSVPDNNEDIFELYTVLNQPYTEELYRKLTRRNVMHKLTYKMDLQKVTADNKITLYGYLLKMVYGELR